MRGGGHGDGPQQMSVEVSFLQLYEGKKLSDLLVDPDSSSTPPLKIRFGADPDSGPDRGGRARGGGEGGGVIVENLSRHLVTSLEDMRRLISVGSANRKVAHTQLNSSSSRSHALITVYVTRPDGVFAKLNLVDLAGSERTKVSIQDPTPQDRVQTRPRSHERT